MISDKKTYEVVANYLNSICASLNFKVAESYPTGKPAKVSTNTREFRLQLINKNNDTSALAKKELPKFLSNNKDISNVQFHELSENSSKYSSVSFTLLNKHFDVIIAKGANKGETFEVNTLRKLQSALHTTSIDEYTDLLEKMVHSNQEFSRNEIVSVSQRTGSTKKENVPIERLGQIIADIILKDSSGKNWFISLKDVNGDTFSSYSGASSIFDNQGTVQENSEGSEFLKSFGVDLNRLQEGFDVRNDKKEIRKPIAVERASTAKLTNIFRRAWGMNYFYVRRLRNGWKVFWLDSNKLNQLTSNITVNAIQYPSTSSKQVTILCSNSYAKYKVEIRNSKGGEYPNDIKFKIVDLK